MYHYKMHKAFLAFVLLNLFGIIAGAANVTLFYDSAFAGTSMGISDDNGIDACYTLPASFQSKVSSLSVIGAKGITAYSLANCQGQSNSFVSPVSWMGDIWSDRMISFKFVSSLVIPTVQIPATPEISYGVCEMVLVVDNYITRTLNKTMTVAEIYDKYRSYQADINAYYQNNFNLHMRLSYIYVEDSSSFTSTTDSGTLLSDFTNAIAQKKFGSAMPSNACIYHLLTGRQPSGVAGLAYLGTTCTSGATGFAVDANGLDGAGIVLRRSIHEIGHNLNGNHPDGYVNQIPPFSPCSINNDIGVYRILRDTTTLPFTYLEEGSRISECATNQMRNSMSAFPCFYKNSAFTSPFSSPSVIFYADSNYGGAAFPVVARRGLDACYNLMSFSNTPSSFKANSTNIVGIKAYQNSDCRGLLTIQDFATPTSSLNLFWNDKIVSFKFITNV